MVNPTVAASLMKQTQVVETYKRLAFVEPAFGCLRTVALEIRPVDHKKDDRVRRHLLLAYDVYWQMRPRLSPLFDQDGPGMPRKM